MTNVRSIACFVLLLLACKKGDDVAPAPAASVIAVASAASAPVVASASAIASAPAAPTSPAPSLKSFPGTEGGAKLLLAELVKPGADTAGISAQLRPTTADYKAIYDPKLAAKLEKLYSPQWDAGTFTVAPRPGQTVVLLDAATVADLKAGTSKAAKDFPGGYKMVSSHLVGAATLYRFKFVEPGKELGMAYDGLAHVNGHWVLIPKPWRALDDH